MKVLRLKVGATKYPSMKAGQIGFFDLYEDDKCLAPHYSYKNGGSTGYIHTRDNNELLTLVNQIGAMTKEQFMAYHGIKPSGIWRNAYISYLDKELETALLTTGIKLNINGNDVEFYTMPGFYRKTSIR